MHPTRLALAGEYHLDPENEEKKDSKGNNYRWGTLVGDMYFSETYKTWSVPVLSINTVRNEMEGNGQFRQFLAHTIDFCNAQQCDLLALNVTPQTLAAYLITRWGFEEVATEPGLVYRCVPRV